MFMELNLATARREPYSEHYGFLKNKMGFTYEELVKIGYTEELGYTLKVFTEVYKKDAEMFGGYFIESSGDIIPAETHLSESANRQPSDTTKSLLLMDSTTMSTNMNMSKQLTNAGRARDC